MLIDQSVKTEVRNLINQDGLYQQKQYGDTIVYDKNNKRLQDLDTFICKRMCMGEVFWSLVNKVNEENSWGEVQKALTEYLRAEFPLRTRHRNMFLFKNGCYHAETDSFGPCPPGVIPSCDMKNMDFNVPNTEWRDIPTPNLDGICKSECLTPKDIEVLFVMMGRLLSPLGKHDSWNCVVYLQGKSESKNVICKFFGHLFDPSTVAWLGGSHTFADHVIDNAFIYVGHRMYSTKKVNEDFFNRMIGKIAGIFAGEEEWTMLKNRPNVVTIKFNGDVNNVPTEESLEKETAHILVKANRAYREYAAKYASITEFM